MTIDERIENLATASHCFDSQFRAYARLVLLEVARDQRHACAEAVNALVNDPKNNGHNRASLLRAHQAVMNATIK